MKTITIKTDDSWKIIYQEEITLDDLQKAVGGWIEGVCITSHLVMYCNEEGKMNYLPINNIATGFLWSLGKKNDVIVGDVIFVKTDDEGEHISLSEEDINGIIDYIESYQNTPQ